MDERVDRYTRTCICTAIQMICALPGNPWTSLKTWLCGSDHAVGGNKRGRVWIPVLSCRFTFIARPGSALD
ncbi:hypothetical protein I7I50_00605 [Histoplasma capsulatum G186AR]|uniref:Uncharacterized protein n=1 Tax=Ajellomyces capsulatus TaxID=5037 RepID=A0A8H7YE68_AJECA|nr:hypothetical protein I7I52_07873 [Histoplasma capsulatum]QSS72682.1 hypothetical protein I7I50_00605 [Histoplasma capsulatum G186AR]